MALTAAFVSQYNNMATLFLIHISILYFYACLSVISWLHYTISNSNRVKEADSTQAQNISTGSESNKPGSLALGQLDMHSGKVQGHT